MKTRVPLWPGLVFLPIIFCGCLPLSYHSSEGSFAGLGRRLNQTARTNAVLQMLLVHGIGDHCPGYGDTFANRVAAQLKLVPCGNTNLLALPCSIATNWLREFGYAEGHRRLAVYELTWTPTTFPYKTNAFTKDRQLSPRRVLLNRTLKHDVMDEGLGDAVLYLNPFFRSKMQEAILAAINHIETQAGPNDKLVLVASSLGSKMTFDTVEKWAEQSLSVQNFAARTTDILMLANQLPLLHLGTATNEFAPPPPGGSGTPPPSQSSLKAFVQIGRDQQKKEKKRERPSLESEDPNRFVINVVAATDPNDLLSYPLRGDDVVPEDPGDGDKIVISVSNLYAHNAWAIPFLFENPAPAHENYDQNAWLIKKFVQGFSNAKPSFPKPVPETFTCDQKNKKHL